MESKLARTRAAMKEAGATAHVLTTLDDICWTLNIRGNDVEYFPLVLTYAVIRMDKVDLFVNEKKLSDEIKAHLAADGVILHPYNDIYEDIKKVAAEEVLMVDPGRLNFALYKNIPENVKKVEERNPAILFKCVKNPTEVENIRIAEIKDSVAHVRFMKWLKENVGKETITEMSASDKLDEFRAEMGGFIRPSFGPISAFGEHSAIVHYSSSPETNVELHEGTFLMTDTGAGFYEGSTDITRTYAFGEVSQIMKDHFTLVAISNLNLASPIFKKGCCGMNFDYLARKPFWDRGLDFNHGTGHGVGYLLNVHEGPNSFRWKNLPGNPAPVLEEGMITSDEPGYYLENEFGIRHENLVLCKKAEKTPFGQFMCFESLTMVPFDLDGVDPEQMSDRERKLLNEYHKKVYVTIAPYLDEEEKEWLRQATREI